MGILKHHHLYIQYINTKSPSSASTISLSSSYLVCRNTRFLHVTLEHGLLCHHNCGYHIESLLCPSSGQRDLISSFEAIWLHNLVEQSAMYSASTVLRETLDCFLLNHELIADFKAYT